jgi:hypothetical protein
VYDAQAGDLHFSLASDFVSCINGCAEWNTNSSLPQCIGISFALGIYGPAGQGKGSWCMYRWVISQENLEYEKGWSVALLQLEISQPTVKKHL